MLIKDKDVLMIDKHGNIVTVYKSFSEATEALNLSAKSLISKVCKEEYGSCSGYYWLTGKMYKQKIDTLTFDKWLKNNVKITKSINRETMPIVKLDKETYQLLGRYSSLKEAAIENNLDNKNGYDAMVKCCKFTRRTAKGYIWLLAEDYDSMSLDEIKSIHNSINNSNPNSKKISKFTMPIVKIDKTTYELIDSYESVMDAARKNDMDDKIGTDSIIRCCRFARKSAKGFAWMLKEDYDKMSLKDIEAHYNGEKPSYVTDRKTFNKTPIVQLNPDTFEFIKVFSSINEAAETLGLNKSGISKCCKFQRRSSGNFCWMYLDDFRELSLEEIEDIYTSIFWN